jgi:uncharacterized protein
MFVELSQIPKEGLDLSYSGDYPALAVEGLCEPRAPVEVAIYLERHGEGVMASGAFSTVVGLSCSRCLIPFVLPVHDEFHVFFVPPPSFKEDEEVELGLEELDVEFLVEDRIDVDHLVKENILLNLPVQPLCREDCRGLCQRCGANLNEGSCSCAEEEIDPRLELLKRLL